MPSRNRALLLLNVFSIFVIVGVSLLLPRSYVRANKNRNLSKTIEAKALIDHDCYPNDEWHFVITQISNQDLAPSSIFVEWHNNQSETVNMDKFTGEVAHYTSFNNLNSTVKKAEATIYSEWDGQFNLSHGPCPTTTPTTTLTPTEVTPTPEETTPTPTEVEETPTPTETEEPTNTPTPTEEPEEEEEQEEEEEKESEEETVVGAPEEGQIAGVTSEPEASARQQILGAASYAETGVFDEHLYTITTIMGSISGAGSLLLKKKNEK